MAFYHPQSLIENRFSRLTIRDDLYLSLIPFRHAYTIKLWQAYRSARGSLLRAGSFTIAMRRRNASSIRIHPRSAYDMLSFQNERYP